MYENRATLMIHFLGQILSWNSLIPTLALASRSLIPLIFTLVSLLTPLLISFGSIVNVFFIKIKLLLLSLSFEHPQFL